VTESVLSDSELAALSAVAEQFEEPPGHHGDYGVFDFAAREAGVLRQMSLLPAMHQRHAEQLGVSLAEAFGLRFSATAVAPRMISYGDLVMSLEDDVALMSFRLGPLRGTSYLACPASLLSVLVNQFFGGSADVPTVARRRKNLSPGEQRMAVLFGQRILESLRESWSERLELEPADLLVLPNIDKLAAEPADNQAVNLEINLTDSGDWSGVLRLLIPFPAIEPFKQRLAKAPARQEPAAGGAWRAALEEHLPAVPLGLTAELIRFDMTLGEILRLQQGMTLPFEMPDNVAVYLEDLAVGEGSYGSNNNRKAVRIQSFGSRTRGGA
jgi:flagellar motor switch protein FliM|tara:strand:+ start:334390 stop:335367 length:978 start_codon:yes stop_codon:yes gene_type:complete